MKLISIDGGTTNTRLTLLESGKVLDVFKIKIGAGNVTSVSGENPYIAPLRNGIAELLKRNNLKEADIPAVLLSGMISSEGGLRLVPHIFAPADAIKSAQSALRVLMSEITCIPIYFIPGVRTDGTNALDIDMMRGEETELYGIYSHIGVENFVAVMPGSHTKIVRMTAGGTVETFCTSLTGELIRATAEHTILKNVLYDVFPKTEDTASLCEGYDCCEKIGINASLFKVRVLSKFSDITKEQLFAFLTGVCMHADVQTVLKYADGAQIFVGGSNPFRTAYLQLISLAGCANVSELPEYLAEHAAAYGAEVIFSKLLNI